MEFQLRIHFDLGLVYPKHFWEFEKQAIYGNRLNLISINFYSEYDLSLVHRF